MVDAFGSALRVQRYESVQELVNFVLALVGSVPILTLLDAARRGAITWLPATAKQIGTHGRDTWATFAGHERWLRGNQRSTDPSRPPLPPTIAVDSSTTPAWWASTQVVDATGTDVHPLPNALRRGCATYSTHSGTHKGPRKA